MSTMTKRERIGKEQIYRKLASTGYVTYANLFNLFDLHLTKDPGVVGYMIPDKAVITINENLDIDQVSTVVRHEILHEFFEHKKRLDKITGGKLTIGDAFNIAADYEISNRGYTEADKSNVRNLKLGDKFVRGLVTEDDHPDWADKTFEEMYDLLKQESPESMKNPQIGNTGDQSIQDAEEAERRAQKIKEQAEGDIEEANKQLGSNDGKGGKEKKKEQGEGEASDDSSNSEEGEEENKEGSGDGQKPKRNRYDDEAYKNMSPEEKKKERARRRKEEAKKLKEQADSLIDKIKDTLSEAKGQPSPKGGAGNNPQKEEIFDTPEEQQEIQERIKEIRRILDNLEEAQKAENESARAIQSEKAARAARDLNRYKNSPLTKFTESLNKFMRDAVARGRNDSWSHINKKYVNSGLLRPGQSWSSRGKIPLINVYFDRSGSWDSAKTDKGQQAIATLNRYVIRGEIQIKLYYFSEGVHESEATAKAEGGTNGQPILDHIEATRPNNVIIMTDSDIDDCRTKVSVPGAVWFIWVGGISNNLKSHLEGDRLTESFELN